MRKNSVVVKNENGETGNGEKMKYSNLLVNEVINIEMVQTSQIF